MITWQRQGAAVVGAFCLRDGQYARVVLIGGRDNPKGAVVIAPRKGDTAIDTFPLMDHLRDLKPDQIVEILCMQERVFGSCNLLEPPELL